MRSISHLPAALTFIEFLSSCAELPVTAIQEVRNSTSIQVQASSDMLAPKMSLWEAVQVLDDFALNAVPESFLNFGGYRIVVHAANDLIVQVLIKTPDGKKFLYRHDIEGVKVLDSDSGIVLFASGIEEEDAPPDRIVGDPEVARQILADAVRAFQQ